MNSDLRGELGPLDPGLGQLIEALTAGPAGDELAGEQAALAMFRQTSRPSASTVPRQRGAANPAGRTTRAAGQAARISARWTLRLAGATALMLAGGLTAAYANVLPAPVQHLAHVALSFADVPDAHHPPPRRARPVHHNARPAARPDNSPGLGSPAPSTHAPGRAQPTASASPSASRKPSPSPSPSQSPSAAAGQVQISASTVSGPIAAGSVASIDGQLTRAGQGLSGVTVTLLERHARHAAWRVAGTGITTAQGDVAITSPVIITNAAFRLTGPAGVKSAIVRVTVRPTISVALQPSANGLRDVLVVSTQYARRGNIVVLQIESKTGRWVDLRGRTLNANGHARFAVSTAKLKNRVLRVVLLATVRHAASVSNAVTVPPPG